MDRRSIVRPCGMASALLLLICVTAAGDAGAVGSVSTVAPRPLGMGGAFVAVADEIAAMAWNPAGFLPPRPRAGGRLRAHLNALGGPAIVRETGLLTGVETEPYRSLPGAEKLSVAVGSVVKAVSFRRGGFAVGALMLEEELDPVGLAESKGLADASDLLDGYYSSLCIAFSMAPGVSIGASETLFARLDRSGRRQFGSGRAYGALLRPNDQVSVGLMYFDAPPEFEDVRRTIEGLAPRTMNAGVSYTPRDGVLLTFDLRDMAEKHSGTALAPRLGAEWIALSNLALRAGGYREEPSGSDVLTLGVGAIAMGDRRLRAWGPRGDALVVDYAVLLSNGTGPRHLLSVILHF